jgi:hypothetical protein
MESERNAHVAALQSAPAWVDATILSPSSELFGELEPPLPTADSLPETIPQSVQSKDKPRPADSPAGEIIPRSPASEEPVPSTDMGANVELF